MASARRNSGAGLRVLGALGKPAPVVIHDLHGGKTQRQVAGELDVSEYSLNLWKKQYLRRQPSAEINAQEQSPAQMTELIRQQHKEIEYLKRQREILKKAMSILGEEPGPGMR
jgi:transposase-like protein